VIGKENTEKVHRGFTQEQPPTILIANYYILVYFSYILTFCRTELVVVMRNINRRLRVLEIKILEWKTCLLFISRGLLQIV